MNAALRLSAFGAISGVVLMAGLGLQATAYAAAAADIMPVETQNDLVRFYCAGCHSGEKLQGALSFEGFDAAHADPTIAGLMAIKLQGGAISAAGVPIPDEATVSALMNALAAEGAGAEAATGGWTLSLANAPGPLVIASIVQQVPSATTPRQLNAYVLKLTCHMDDTHQAQMQLATYTKAQQDAGMVERGLSSVGQSLPFSYENDGVSSSAFLFAAQKNVLQASFTPVQDRTPGAAQFPMELPEHEMTLRDVFAGEAVTFTFDGLTPPVRQILASCFSGRTSTASN